MVVLSSAIISGSGKALVSRQFVEMNRMRIEGLLAAFPKLVGHAKQHTYVETESVRYVYQPLENDLFLLLITTKASNIVEDLSTLRLLAKVVPDVAGTIHEQSINEHAFELIFAFDEVLTAGGYREEVSLSAIRTNLLMDSHEEKMHQMIQESKQAAAQEEMKKRAKDIKERQMQQIRQNFMQGAGGPGMGGMGGGGGMAPGQMEGFGGGGGGPGGPGAGGFAAAAAGFAAGFDSSGGAGGMGGGAPASGGYQNWDSQPTQPAAPVDDKPKVVAKGMKLGGVGKKKDNLMAAMAAEDNLGFGKAPSSGDAFGLGLGSAAAAAPVAAPSVPLVVALEEKISCQMNREGGIESCDVKGTLTLTANTDAGSAAVVVVNKALLNSQASTFTSATHPKVNKPGYEADGTLALKGGKGFPVGRPVGVLRWSYAGEDAAPLTINCWPEDDGTGGVINVNIEFELNRPDMVLNDVNIVLPLGTTSPPDVHEIDGVYKHDPNAGMLCWHHDKIDSSNGTGSLEFSIPGHDVDAFFPCQISFRSDSLLCPVQIASVTSSATGANIPNQMTQQFVPESYQCA